MKARWARLELWTMLMWILSLLFKHSFVSLALLFLILSWGCTNFCTWLCILSSPAWGMWDPGRGRLAVSHPGKLRYSLHLSTVSVCCQSPHRRGNNHHGDRLPRLRRRRQGEPAPASQREYRTFWTKEKFLLFVSAHESVKECLRDHSYATSPSEDFYLFKHRGLYIFQYSQFINVHILVRGFVPIVEEWHDHNVCKKYTNKWILYCWVTHWLPWAHKHWLFSYNGVSWSVMLLLHQDSLPRITILYSLKNDVILSFKQDWNGVEKTRLLKCCCLNRVWSDTFLKRK